MSGLKILVVEDDLELRTFYQLALLEQGHAVNAVANGAEALEAVSPEIELIVTDLTMPVMPGDKLIAEQSPSSARAGPLYCESHSSSTTSWAGSTRQHACRVRATERDRVS